MSAGGLANLEGQEIGGMNKTKFANLAAFLGISVKDLRIRIGAPRNNPPPHVDSPAATSSAPTPATAPPRPNVSPIGPTPTAPTVSDFGRAFLALAKLSPLEQQRIIAEIAYDTVDELARAFAEAAQARANENWRGRNEVKASTPVIAPPAPASSPKSAPLTPAQIKEAERLRRQSRKPEDDSKNEAG